MSESSVKIALAGNPNSGKTSMFNALTGSRQHVGNYPGITVEKKEGHYLHDGRRFDVLDLPGTYSLTSFSPEERIARREILSGEYQVIVVVVDSTNLRRNLYLLTQIMLAGANPVLCLNMSDEAQKAGQRLDVEQMRKLLGLPVIQTVGNRGVGVKELKDLVAAAADNPANAQERLVFGDRFDAALNELAMLMDDPAPDARPGRWLAVKLLEQDEPARRWVQERFSKRLSLIEERRIEITERLEDETGLDIVTLIADRHYGFISGLLLEVVLQEARADAHAFSDRIDRIVCNRFFGPLFFMASMYLLFFLTFTLGEYPMEWIETVFNWLGVGIAGLWPEGSESPLKSLLVDGVIGGVGGVVVFIPNIAFLFLGLAFLEDSGYMARAAFLVDKIMHKFGLHGKSFIPMLTGFGCTIPGIMATRTLENERDRLTTMLVLPLISCGARLPIWMLLIPAFFSDSLRAPMLFGIYVTGILLAVFLARLLRSTILRGEDAPFVMELPPYRLPTVRGLLQKTGERSWLYLRKAGTIILGLSILLWAISSFPKQAEAPIDRAIEAGKVVVIKAESPDGLSPEEARAWREDTEIRSKNGVPDGVRVMWPEQVERLRASQALEYSIAGRIGGAIQPLLAPLGFDVRITTALIGAFAAKEVFVAQMGIVFSLGGEPDTQDTLREKLRDSYSPLVALSLMLFLLVATPCMATVAVTRRESGSWRWALFQLFGLTAIAWLLSALVYQVGRLFV